MRAGTDDLTLVDDKDMIAVHNGGNTLCHENGGAGIGTVLAQCTAVLTHLSDNR